VQHLWQLCKISKTFDKCRYFDNFDKRILIELVIESCVYILIVGKFSIIILLLPIHKILFATFKNATYLHLMRKLLILIKT